jgi:5'-nucleotidase
VQPFQNRLVRLTLTGKVLRDALEHALAGADGRPDAHVAGLAVWYDPAQPSGHRITRLRLADGATVDDAHTYTLAVSDFLATGGSGYAMLHNGSQDEVGTTDLDALMQYLTALPQPIAAPEDTRWHR